MQKNKDLFTSISVTAISIAIATESHAVTTFTFDQVGIFSGAITHSGIYDVRVRGANGGSISFDGRGGIGALLSASVYLSAGYTFTVLVGGVGGGSYTSGGAFVSGAGGGGLSFLDIQGSNQGSTYGYGLNFGLVNFKVVAGGGGGAGDYRDGGDASTGLQGQDGTPDFPGIGGAGGTFGSGGGEGNRILGLGAGGGAGLYANGLGVAGGLSGPSFLGGAAQPQHPSGIDSASGGFGGGGAGIYQSGGGGGGFSGGGGGYYGGGGGGGSFLYGSFLNTAMFEGNEIDYLGINGNGFVSLQLQPVPVPAGMLLFASAMTALFAAQRTKRQSADSRRSA